MYRLFKRGRSSVAMCEALEQRQLLTAYYVSASGNDRNAGTSASSPWQTIARVNKARLSAGDSVLFQGGATFSGSISGKGGTSANPITYGSYGAGRATIIAGTATGFSGSKSAVTIHDLVFVGSGVTSNGGNGIALTGSHLTINSVDVSGFNNNGIDFTGGSSAVRVTNSTVHDCGYAGIQVQGTYDASTTGTNYSNSNVYIGHDTIWNIIGRTNGEKHTGNGIFIWDVNTATVERCVVHDTGINNTNGAGPVGIWCFQATHVTFQYNESYHNLTSSSDGDGFDFDGGTTNSVMQYNYAHDNAGAGILNWQFSGARPMSGNVIRFNICQNDGRRNAFYSELTTGGGPIASTDIYNNTFYSSTTGGATIDSGTTGHFCNNILDTTAGHTPLVSAGSTTLAGNDYWAGGAAVSYSGGVSVDPLLNSPGGGGTIGNADLLSTLTAYRLQSSSSLIGTGVALSSRFGINPGGLNFFGDAVPNSSGYDVGAD